MPQFKTVFITGSSSGIGRKTAELFHKKGWNVVATMRSPDKEKEMQTWDKTLVCKLDVTDYQSIQKAVKLAVKKFGGIDVLVNNAGYGLVGPLEELSEEQIAKQINTNVTGLLWTTKLVAPYLTEQKSGAIVNVGSFGGRITFPYYSAYHATKWAVDGFSESLSYEMSKFNVKVRVIEPGPVKTDFYTRSLDGFSELKASSKYAEGFNYTTKRMGMFTQNGASSLEVANQIYKAATSKTNRLRYPVGRGVGFILLMKRLLPTSWFIDGFKSVVMK